MFAGVRFFRFAGKERKGIDAPPATSRRSPFILRTKKKKFKQFAGGIFALAMVSAATGARAKYQFVRN
jgi:hypothetical protein